MNLKNIVLIGAILPIFCSCMKREKYVTDYQLGWYWQNPLPQGNTLRAVHFINTNIGTAVGRCGTVLHTADGGRIWTKQNSG
ncbi:MAG: hypothetical protein ACRENG_38860, partial [bacterium]